MYTKAKTADATWKTIQAAQAKIADATWKQVNGIYVKTQDATWKQVFEASGGIDEYTTLILHCEGSDGSTTIPDSSTATNKGNAGIAGGAALDTAQYVFGTSSLLLDGTGDYISYGHSVDWYMPADFCIDFWVRFNAMPADLNYYCFCIDITDATTYWGFFFGRTDPNYRLQFQAFTGGVQQILMQRNLATTPTTGEWYHVAISRSGNNHYMFWDGALLGTTQTDTGRAADNTGSLLIGMYSDGTSFGLNGWMDEIRFSKGVYRWKKSFTPPTKAYSE